MSRRGSILDVEDESEAGSEEEDEDEDNEDSEEVSVKKRFDEIRHSLQNDKINLRDADELKRFAEHNKGYLGKTTTAADDDQNTLLHLLVDDAKDKVFSRYQPLVKLLIDSYPELLEIKDNSDRTPLYISISKKREKLVRFLCNTHPNIDAILAIPCLRSDNCLHAAIKKKTKLDLTIFLIDHAGERALCAQDDMGKTPLHLAVEYERCTDAQLQVVKALTRQCDKAMNTRTLEPDGLSPYGYHEYTRAEARKAAEAEAKKAIKQKEKEAAQEKRDDMSVASGEGLLGKDGGGGKFKASAQAKDPKSLKIIASLKTQDEPFFDAELEKLDSLNYANARSQTPLKKYANVNASLTAYKSAGLASGSAEPSKAPFDAPTGIVRTKSSGWKSSSLKKPMGLRKGKRKTKEKEKDSEDANVTERSADAILNFLKLHCMRTMKHDNAVDFLYGRNQEKQIYFDLCDYLSLTITEEHISNGFAHLKFEDILQYVAFPNMKFEQQPIPHSKFLKKQIKTPDGNGRNDMVFLFDFLRKKGVRRIIRVIVDDKLRPAHSDEAIERALGGLRVETWDWQKFDLCAETIISAAPDVRKVCLYWSGNNAVLSGWSEQGGLKCLGKLEKVHLHVEQGLETAKRTRENVTKFCDRLKILCPDVEVEADFERQSGKHELMRGPVDAAGEQVAHRHKWLICMDEFADFIQNVKHPGDLYEPVTVALIDDGVDMKEQSLYGKVAGGMSFCPRDEVQNLNKPYYVTGGGHGTAMASLICRVCPKAQLYILKLEEHTGPNSTKQVTAKSAAKAVRAAIDKKVHIISMSWTIEKRAENETGIGELESAIQDAAKAGILMFCAANDQGIARDRSFPAGGREKNIFKIGAATEDGTVWKWVGDLNDVDFIFPGHNVVKERYTEASLESCKTLTGSSVATAIAAGLAALVLYCVQLGALDSEELSKRGQRVNVVTIEDFKALKGHERMKEAFEAMGTSQASGNKYVEVWHVFESAPNKAAAKDKDRRIEIVTDIAVRLRTTKTV